MTTSALVPPPAPLPEGTSYHFTAPNLASTVRLARHWVVDLLQTGGHGRLVDRAALCTSEVVTNAHLHTTSSVITVDVSLTRRGVTVCVCDGAPSRGPRPCPAWSDGCTLRTTGRGLGIVSALADRWATVSGETSKTVWFSLLADGRVTP
ncbi:ATP-binding protein [Streptomyces sp. CC210A]|uniref:ATP-binding protein n=1 Tax=Streptomyces sp. CC210A TaxID=2898184 RepID=UPI001F1EC66D|nr:ATP-binding protein [Streptomyces sp. CC210A]